MNSVEGFTVDYRQYSTIFDRRQSIQSSGGDWEKEEPISSATNDGVPTFAYLDHPQLPL